MIDWRRSARGDVQYVREREWQAAQSVSLWVDTSASMRFSGDKTRPPKADRARLLALALSVLLLRGGERVGLTGGPTGVLTPPRSGRAQAERLKCVSGSAIATPSDHREMVPVNGPGEEHVLPLARGADEQNRIARAELVGVVTERLSYLAAEIGKSLKALGFSGANAGQVVLAGGGAELHGIAEFMQGALGRAVRVGKPPAIPGLPEAHATPGFATLVGLCLYAADDPVDIRSVESRTANVRRFAGLGAVARVLQAVRDYFIVVDELGERYWVYRAGDGIDPETGSHLWFLHGVFG